MPSGIHKPLTQSQDQAEGNFLSIMFVSALLLKCKQVTDIQRGPNANGERGQQGPRNKSRTLERQILEPVHLPSYYTQWPIFSLLSFPTSHSGYGNQNKRILSKQKNPFLILVLVYMYNGAHAIYNLTCLNPQSNLEPEAPSSVFPKQP